MTSTARRDATSNGRTDSDEHLPAPFRVPGSLWLSGALRALSFAAPLLTSAGRLGLGIVVAAVLWVGVLRGQAMAWRALVAVDVLSIALLVVGLFTVDGARAVAPTLAAVALACLLTPSSRRHVGA
ncbi:MAG: hypothetical protein AAGA93_20615 [Actinomycetota bacterium]